MMAARDQQAFCETSVRKLFSFHPSQNSWVVSSELENDAEEALVDDAGLKVLTFNIWFDMYARKTRNLEIVALLKDHEPTVVCLQEVLKDFVVLILADEWIREHYMLSNRTMQGYGCLILLRRRVCFDAELRETRITSNMDRELHTVSFTYGPQRTPVHVSTCHFESLSFREVRRTQLQEYRRLYESLHTSSPGKLYVLCGDFNFCSYRNWSEGDTSPLENHQLPELLPEFVDVWPSVHGVEPATMFPPEDPEHRFRMGYTFDTDKNHNIGDKRPEFMRYDRILAASSSMKATAIQLVGCEPCRQKFPEKPRFKMFSFAATTGEAIPVDDVLPSDHFGLLAQFQDQANAVLAATDQAQ